MRNCMNLRDLLERSPAAAEYYDSLPLSARTALRRQESVTTFAEMQSLVADEREPGQARAGRRGVRCPMDAAG